MNPFLDSNIHSVGSGSSLPISDILQGAILSASDLTLITQKLKNVNQFTPVILNQVSSQTFISASDFNANINSIMSTIQTLFTYSNNISLLLESLNGSLISKIKLLEKQISLLETRLEDYSFLVSDNNSYSYNYTEHFHDNSGRDSFSWKPSDRNGIGFAKTEEALINPLSHTLMLSKNIIDPYPLVASFVTGNATGLVTSDTGIENSVTSIASLGWRSTYTALKPITSTLPGFDTVGAQVVLNFALNQSAYASQIEVVPFSDTPLELVQIRVSDSNDRTRYSELLTSPMIISEPTTITMPSQAVAQFQLLLNQPTYRRDPTHIDRSIQQVDSISNQHSKSESRSKRNPQKRRWSYSEFFDIYSNYDSTFPAGNIKKPKTYHNSQSVQLKNILRNQKTKLGPYMSWDVSTAQESVINQIFTKNNGYYKKIFKSVITSENFLNTNIDSSNIGINDPAAVAAMPTPIVSNNENSFGYNYDLGLQYVAIGHNSTGERGVFISKPLPATGAIGQVRIKTSDTNTVSSIDSLDMNLITSSEYSVSNISNPQNEKDWIPILPVNVTNQMFVKAERFFPNPSGVGFFRFSANRSQSIRMFKNGYNFEITPDNYMYDTSSNVVLGIRLASDSFSTSDRLVVSYNTGKDYSSITLPNLDSLPVASKADTNGAGETFANTSGRNSITLSETPYVDNSQVKTSNYTFSYGMVPYQPINVILNDGRRAINLTNYGYGAKSDLSSFPSGYYYIQSGNTIMFNVPINSQFTVYYQYIVSNVRVRIVERANSKDFASPKVNAFSLKAKLIHPNANNSLGLS